MRTVRAGALLLFILFLCMFLCVGCRLKIKVQALVAFLDVGQGSAALLQTPDGNVLVDCGPEGAQESLCRKLRSRGVKTLKFMILTHMDEDHIGGADLILEQFAVETILYNGSEEKNESFARLLTAAERKNLSMVALDRDDEAILGDLKITVLHPTDRTDPGEGNQSSLTFFARYGALSILFMGDADRNVEEQLLENPGADNLSATVLQVGHHGSETSSSSEFLAAVHPSYAVISCGAGNSYGHPDGRALERLKKTGAVVCRTDLEGDITLFWNGSVLQKQY